MSQVNEPTVIPDLDRTVARLTLGAADLFRLSLDRRLQLINQCIDGVTDVANHWIQSACDAKQIPAGSAARSEEITTGPVSTVRFLQLLAQTVRDVQATGKPKLPGSVRYEHDQCRVNVFPTPLLFDSILFRPLSAETWLESAVRSEDLFGKTLARFLGEEGEPDVVVVLGAGNVSSIPATDALTKILVENRAVVLKMNPVNDYLGELFSVAFKSLIDAGFLAIVYGGVHQGSHLISHNQIKGVHITGSHLSHNRIVWGDDEHAETRRNQNDPILKKTITSELGNVSPWAIVPGQYTDKQLRYQAEMIATSITNNASFNCIATKLILTCKDWPQRKEFLDRLDQILAKTPPRYAYYPGAADRFQRFSGESPDDPFHLPWKIIRDVQPIESPHLLGEESFVCVCAETSINADSATDFLFKATDYMNNEVWGTLAASLTLPRGYRDRHAMQLDQSFRRLRYGTVGVNIWPALSFALMSPPWGGHPSGTLLDVQSGIGFVHNTYLLDRPEKTILQAPLTMAPKPIWHSNHRHPERVTANLLQLYHKPTWLRMLPLSVSSFTG